MAFAHGLGGMLLQSITARPATGFMDALIQSFSMVAIAEIGDKTQLLSILLAARFRRFWPILLGILAATTANHALVAWLGSEIGGLLEAKWLQLTTALLFIAVGIWTLIPDDAPEVKEAGLHGAFVTSCVLFFMAEMGDKTQLATLTLGARYASTMQVIFGTTLGMLAANIPALLFGEAVLRKIPLRVVHAIACLIFMAFGAAGLWEWYKIS